MTLIDWIEGAMLSDDDNREHQSDLLARLYRHADAGQQNALDAALICLCGWTLTHALKMAASTAAEEGT